MTKQLLSIVLPCYNEEKNIPLIYKALKKQIAKEKLDYELIFINDGSSDTTWAQIQNISKDDPKVRGISFSRNFGHNAALEAGLNASIGEVIVMMDADLQHPPELIHELLTKWREGFDVVNTVRERSENLKFTKRLTSKWFYKILNNMSDLELREGEADYRLVSRQVLEKINSLSETPKFYRGLINWIGYSVAHVTYKAPARLHGESSYTLKKMLELARLGLTSFSMKPLKLIIAIGLALVLGAFFSLIAMIVIKFGFNSQYFSNNAILVMFLVFITGILATFQGIVAVYLVDIFNAAKNRPSYIVMEEINGKKLN